MRQATTDFRIDATPARWAFSIWGILYLWLAVIVVWNAVDPFLQTKWWSATAMGMPSLWILAFGHRQIEAAAVVLVLCVVAAAQTLFGAVDADGGLTNGLALYLGWLCSATLLNLCIVLQDYGVLVGLGNDMALLTGLCAAHALWVGLTTRSELVSTLGFTAAGLWTAVAVTAGYTARSRWLVGWSVLWMVGVLSVALVRIFY